MIFCIFLNQNVGNLVLCTPLCRLTERRHCLCTKPSVRNGRYEYRYVLGLLVHGKVVVVFSRKVFFVNCLVRKTFNMAKISITDFTKALPFTQKISVRIQGNMNAM